VSDDSLIQAMPDVVAFVRPDGLITHHLGGRQVSFVHGSRALAGRRLHEVLQAEVAALINRLVRRALASRGSCEAEFTLDGATYQARISAQGRERALCVIRRVTEAPRGDPSAATAPAAGRADRRGFVRRFKESVADAALRERPLALCVIFLDGLTDISQLIDFSISERILTDLLQQLPVGGTEAEGATWYVGQVGEALLGAVIEGSVDRDTVRAVASSICEVLRRPVHLADAKFHLTPCAGVAILGQDATRPPALLEHAHAAMLESRRTAGASIQFYSDTLRLLPMARLDVERELRMAVAEDQIGLHYVARHDLASGRIVAIHGYMRWLHPLRGEVPPAQFLPIADATGLSQATSRAALERLARDLGALRAAFGPDVAVSFGALRQHLASGQLLRDLRQLLPASAFERGRFELRIAERALATLSSPERTLAEMVEYGADVVVDELGRGSSSLTRLAQLPLRALQIDRALVVAAAEDAAALRSCRAIAALARALDATPIVAGIDDEATRGLMIDTGFTQGLGSHYPGVPELVRKPAAARAAG
jgi:diguanylate cyclase